MLRRIYLGTLIALQLALAIDVVPALAQMLRTHVGMAGLHTGTPAIVQLGTTSLAAVGLAVALAFPAIALLRHHQRGDVRFRGLPRWAIALALAGAAVLAAAIAMSLAGSVGPLDARAAIALIVRPAVTAGIALMAAGALCAELLRRSIAPERKSAMPRRLPAARIEVIDPPELRTRAA